MTSHRLRRSVQYAGVLSVAAALLVSGCSSKKAASSGSSATPTSAGSSSATAPSASGPAASGSAPSTASASGQDLSAMVPASIKSAGVIKVATDASYAPNEFFDTDGKTIIGMDVDLGNAIAQKLGVKADFQNVTFDAIIPALAGGKYDLGMSSFTDTKEREQTVDFVTYFSAGESLIVAQGNPKGVTGPDLTLCGLTVAVEKGTTEEAEIPDLSKKCTDAGKKGVTALSTDDQNAANLALQSGRAQVVSADSPVAEYAVKQSGGKFEIAGKSYETAPYGIAVPKNSGDFAKAIQAALQALMADGTYKQILDKWGIADGAIDSPTINGATG
ncbi:MAG TPA: ABC transporter substrate-binding protein [Acidothermaceae bacterium]